MKIKNRTLSFIIVSLVYVVSSAVGIAVYTALNFELWLNLLIADAIATVVVFIFSVIFKNASVYDPYWSVQPIIILISFALFEQLSAVKIVVLAVVCLWGVRLTANWAYTFKGLTHQDWRYTMLNEKTGVFYPLINFLGIHMFPTFVVYLCVLPATTLIISNATGSPISYLLICISIIGIVSQGVSDCQMHHFRKNRTTEQFISMGLWKYSRHPNYLGEILMWWGVGLCSVTALQSQWYLLLGALVNTLMFLIVSIPMADKRQAKKDGFTEYKKHTHALIPLKLTLK